MVIHPAEKFTVSPYYIEALSGVAVISMNCKLLVQVRFIGTMHDVHEPGACRGSSLLQFFAITTDCDKLGLKRPYYRRIAEGEPPVQLSVISRAAFGIAVHYP